MTLPTTQGDVMTTTTTAVIPATKLCATCMQSLPAHAFNRSAARPFGLSASCRECLREAARKRKGRARKGAPVPAAVPTQECPGCREEQPLNAFPLPRSRRRSQGDADRDPYCVTCRTVIREAQQAMQREARQRTAAEEDRRRALENVARAAAGATNWRHLAACRREDPELFFPVGNSGPALVQVENAKRVCGRCPVREECLAWALETGQDAGVWGGMSEDDRRSLRRRASRHRTTPAQEAGLRAAEQPQHAPARYSPPVAVPADPLTGARPLS